MTPEQKQALLNHAELYGPASTSRNDDGDFFMTDGEVVKFTNCIRYDANSKYEINNEPFHMIWFSQLNRVFLDDDFYHPCRDYRCIYRCQSHTREKR